MRPFLACDADLDKITYPIYASIKLDGVRCLARGAPTARSMKLIPNRHIQNCLNGLTDVDGELMVEGDFNSVQSAVMSSGGRPNFTYHIFDFIGSGPFTERLERARQAVATSHYGEWLRIIPQVLISCRAELDLFYKHALEDEEEGVVLRKPSAWYKNGRSTLREQGFLRLVPWKDDEGVIVRIEERFTNTNEQTSNELGYAQRSSHASGKVPAGTAGAVVISWKGKVFKVGFGKGFDDRKKLEIWDSRQDYVGLSATFYYKNLSAKGVPRQGKFKGIRLEL